MHYVDSQRTSTRRESSLITRQLSQDVDSDSSTSVIQRRPASVRTEIITLLFESMLDTIVLSWNTLEIKRTEEEKADVSKEISEEAIASIKKKPGPKQLNPKKSGSKLNMNGAKKRNPMKQIWWSSPDEKAIIHFRNGNMYEGNISMKHMHGEGRFQWSDGTIYFGQFHYNEIKGKGRICWKDDTWYDGDFAGNIRHGKGIYVDSRKQSSYYGEWDSGTKHGEGIIYYDGTFKNNYVGDWVRNVRHGYGAREYCAHSGYKGNWEHYIRDGKGLTIWANHDYYQGGWRNGLMSGYGIYIWNAQNNNTLALPIITIYRGDFQMNERLGKGVLYFGLDWGAHYNGRFKNNVKHGYGILVTNNGLILQDESHNDIIRTKRTSDEMEQTSDVNEFLEPLYFNICDEYVGLRYHVEKAYENLERGDEIRASTINDYIKHNRYIRNGVSPKEMTLKEVVLIDSQYDHKTLDFEETALRKVVKAYNSVLINIYNKYCEICNNEPVSFRSQLIRLFLWKFYWDCNLHTKGMTLVKIDNIFHSNAAWLSRSPHYPFQKIFFWQFVHSVIAVASRLYARKVLPGPKPDTIVASAFRKFMEDDVLLARKQPRWGRFTKFYASYIPLKALYALYRTLGEPHTVRQFICAVRRPSHDTDHEPVDLVDGPDDIKLGRNVYIFGDRICYVMDDTFTFKKCTQNGNEPQRNEKDLLLFNFSNLSTPMLVKIFANIFPQVLSETTIMSLDIEMTFFEFFEAFVACAEESIRVKEEKEKMKLREMYEQIRGYHS